LYIDYRRVVRFHNQRAKTVIELHLVDFGGRKLNGRSGGRLENHAEHARRQNKTHGGAPAE
jgi:hypothetical protein